MADTVDHDDLAEEVAGAPKETQELTAAQWRKKLCAVAQHTDAQLAHVVYLVRKGAELAALEALAAERKALASLMRELLS